MAPPINPRMARAIYNTGTTVYPLLLTVEPLSVLSVRNESQS